MHFCRENYIIIGTNLAILHFHSLDCFKFTGPFNIGKSVTLLEYCRTSDSAFYINLKILTNKPIYDCYSILQEEFSRISLNLLLSNIKFFKALYSPKIVNELILLKETSIYCNN